jgi:hypothetical protein
MTTVTSDLPIPAEKGAVPPALLIAGLMLCVLNASLLQSGFTAHWWLFDENGLGIPTDFVNVWSAGRLGLDEGFTRYELPRSRASDDLSVPGCADRFRRNAHGDRLDRRSLSPRVFRCGRIVAVERRVPRYTIE